MPAYTNGILSQLPGLNWLLLVEVITVVIASLFWFFYLNRFIVRRTYIEQLTSQGLLLSWAIRLYTWRYLNARIEIRAINIAPLAGRIAFKDVRYYSRNQSLRVLKGHVTWRYWLWRVRDDEIGAKVRNNQSRPCRFAIELEGVEWFLYNRTDSYDKVLEAIGLRYDEETGKVEKAEESIRMDAVGKRPASTDNSGIDWVREILPVEIHAHTGAIILGNRSTPMLLITGFDEVKGAFSVVEARSKFDLYKQVYEFTFSRVRSVFRTNPDFTCSMRDHGRQVVQSLREEHGSLAAADFARTRSPADYLPFPRFFRLLQSLGLDRYVAEYEAKVRGKWEGLARYRPSIDYSITLDAGSSTEYAKVPTLLQAPRIKLEYYCDTAGAVPPLDQQVQNLGGLEGIDIGNGDLTPEWGVDVSIEAGRINYGPWTERQRSELFALFLPATYNDEPATVRKQPGDLREHVALKIFIQFDDKTVIHLPTREQSKVRRSLRSV